MAVDPPEPTENLVDHSDSSSQPSQQSGDTSNGSKGDSNVNNNVTSNTSRVASRTEDDERESSSPSSSGGEAKQGEQRFSDNAVESPPLSPKVEVSRQTLSEYQNAKRKAKQVRMTAMMARNATLEEEEESVEPNDSSRSASWKPARKQGPAKNSNAYSSVPNLPTSPTKRVSKKTSVRRVPSTGPNSPKSARSSRARAKEQMYSRSDHGPRSAQYQSEKEVNLSYQRLRQQASRPNRPVNTPMSGEDVKLGYAEILSRNHTTGAMPPGHSVSTASSMTMSWGGGGGGDDSSDELTLLRDDNSSDEDDACMRPALHNPLTNNNSSDTSSGGFDDSAMKVEFSRMGIAVRRPRAGRGEGLPSQSEHGTKSTRMNSRRRASLHPIIDDDPRAATDQLEAELIRKSISSNNESHEEAQRNSSEQEAPWPSALAYDPNVPGAHGIQAPGSQERHDRREEFERYDSYLTSHDQYLVSATLVDKDDDDEEDRRQQLIAKDRSERFRLLENRQAELEQQISEQKNLILAHHEELNRLKSRNGEIVQAEVVGQVDDSELGRQIRQQESIIAEKEAELSSLMGRPIPGMALLRKYDQRREKKKKGKLMSKLNPFRRTTETIREMDSSDHSLRSSSNHSKRPSSHSKLLFSKTSSVEGDEDGASGSFREDLDSSAHDTAESELPSREAMLLETKKRSERFIAPEKLPFEDNTISELKQMAEDADVDISGCVERSHIVKNLQDAGVKPKRKGPLNKFFGKTKSPKSTSNKASSSSLNTSAHSPKKAAKKEIKPTVDIPPADMPAPIVMEKQDSFYAPKKADVFEGISISQLKKVARDRNVDVSSCTDRNDLVEILYAAGMRPPGQGDGPRDPLNDLSITELKRLASANNVDISLCVEKEQIIGSLNVAGVRPPKKGSTAASSDNYGAKSWDRISISELKNLARIGNVDVTMCVEKAEIITKLRRAGMVPPTSPNLKKAAPRLSRSELSEWRPAQLQILANQIGAVSSGIVGSDDLLNSILQVANEEKKKLRAPIRAIASLGPAPLGKLRSFATEKDVDISGCVEKDDMLQRIVQKCIR